jgi:hypothetical protein
VQLAPDVKSLSGPSGPENFTFTWVEVYQVLDGLDLIQLGLLQEAKDIPLLHTTL